MFSPEGKCRGSVDVASLFVRRRASGRVAHSSPERAKCPLLLPPPPKGLATGGLPPSRFLPCCIRLQAHQQLAAASCIRRTGASRLAGKQRRIEGARLGRR